MTTDSLNAPVVLQMSEVEPEPVRWLWPGRLPLGRLSLLAGMPGLGKSFATASMAANVSTGSPWPDGESCEKGSVLFVAAEDDPADTIRPRLDAHEADASRVHLLRGVKRLGPNRQPIETVFDFADLAPLERAVEGLSNPRLIIVDPIGSYLGTGIDAHRDNEVRGALAPLAALASRIDVAMLLVAHIRKGTATHADDLVLGSRAFTGLARSVLHLMPDPDDPLRRLLLPGKTNLSAPPSGLSFTIGGDPPRVLWGSDPVTMTAAEVLASIAGGGSGGGALDEAREWLTDTLCGGPLPAKEILSRAEADGIAARTLHRAKKLLGVRSERLDYADRNQWVWVMP